MNEETTATLSREEAKEQIDAILAQYGDTVHIDFRKYDAEIIDSYRVTSTKDRHAVCKLLIATGLTKRTYEDLSAEWALHNFSWRMHVLRRAAKDVSLDYGHDPRLIVRIATKIFDILDIE